MSNIACKAALRTEALAPIIWLAGAEGDLPSPRQQIATFAALQALAPVGSIIWLAVIAGLTAFKRDWVNAALGAWSFTAPCLATSAAVTRTLAAVETARHGPRFDTASRATAVGG